MHFPYGCVAQLLTINWNEYDGCAHNADLIGILESIKQLHEDYEYRGHEFSMWDTNSIGLSFVNIKYKFKATGGLIVILCLVRSHLQLQLLNIY